jgi:hypothetical protein
MIYTFSVYPREEIDGEGGNETLMSAPIFRDIDINV